MKDSDVEVHAAADRVQVAYHLLSGEDGIWPLLHDPVRE